MNRSPAEQELTALSVNWMRTTHPEGNHLRNKVAVRVVEDMVLMCVPDSIILHLSNLDHQHLIQIPIMLRMEFNI